MPVLNYEIFRQVLQVLSYQLGPKEAASPHRWMLKCPIHSLYLEEIKEVFPDAKLIWFVLISLYRIISLFGTLTLIPGLIVIRCRQFLRCARW